MGIHQIKSHAPVCVCVCVRERERERERKVVKVAQEYVRFFGI